MDELSKTYTLAHSPDGWHVHFSTGIAPGFGTEPHYSLFEVIERVETLYPDYQSRLTDTQRANYQLRVARRAHAQELQKIISQTSDLKDGLVDLTRKLPQIGAGQDREIAEDLTTLHHQLCGHMSILRDARLCWQRGCGWPASVVSQQELGRQTLGRSGPRRDPLRSAF
jgi:hypothetical protein